MTKPTDDLEAVRQISEVLEPFEADDRERIIRWVRERLGMATESPETPLTPVTQKQTVPQPPPAPLTGQPGQKNIKSFLEEKEPKTNQRLAAVGAYYHHFLAPTSERRDYITAEDLIEASRKADRHRPTSPGQDLRNAYQSGFFDRGESGQYKLNAVGENLVAMVLPESKGAAGKGAKAARRKRTVKATKKSAAKRRKKAVKKTKKRGNRR